MYSAIRSTVLLLLSGSLWAEAPTLRICADPNNLPFSNDQQQGFENGLARMIADDLGMQIAYTWFPQRGAFFRKTVGAGQCDVVMGVPEEMKNLEMTKPYYRSSYVFVARKDRGLIIHSLDDPRLDKLRIGVQVLGDSDRGSPPAQALIQRGIVDNLVAFNIFGNLNDTNAPANLIKAVDDGIVDIAVAWGPMAGYFARRAKHPLEVTSIDSGGSAIPLAFDIAIGVRRGDAALKQQLELELAKRQAQIDDLLRNYDVPLGELKEH